MKEEKVDEAGDQPSKRSCYAGDISHYPTGSGCGSMIEIPFEGFRIWFIRPFMDKLHRQVRKGEAEYMLTPDNLRDTFCFLGDDRHELCCATPIPNDHDFLPSQRDVVFPLCRMKDVRFECIHTCSTHQPPKSSRVSNQGHQGPLVVQTTPQLE